jgi:hypothetical protein
MKGQFQPGNTPWNKDKKGLHLSPDSEFKEGQLIGKDHPSWTGGVQQPKNDCIHLWDGNGKRVRRPRKVYEDAFGPIPKGYVIIHLDGDKDNDELTNLEAISRAELIKRNNSKLKSL